MTARPISLAIVAGVALTAAACGGGSAPVAKGTVSLYGTSRVISQRFNGTDGWCSSTGGFSDISEGSSVTVYDDKGVVLGAAPLRAGTLIKDPNPAAANSGVYGCSFTIPPIKLTRHAPLYQVGVGNSSRGKLTVQSKDLGNVSVSLSQSFS